MWNTSGSLSILTNTLNISNGGVVTVATTTAFGYAGGSISFGGTGGTLTTQSLYAAPSQLAGTGTINTHGLVTDANLVFNSTYGPIQTVPGFGSVSINLDVSNPSNVGDLGAGLFGSGSLTVQNGVVVNSQNGYLAYNSGSSGTATVDGSGSTWNNNTTAVPLSGNLYVGYDGVGTLKITNGGAVVTSGSGYINFSGTSSCAVTVDGSGSTWTIATGNLWDGNRSSTGGTISTLNISNGGAVVTSGFVMLGNVSASATTSVLNFNGGILRSYNAANPDWIRIGNNKGYVYVQGGGATFDTNGYDMGIGVPLLHGGTASIDGGVTKVGAGADPLRHQHLHRHHDGRWRRSGHLHGRHAALPPSCRQQRRRRGRTHWQRRLDRGPDRHVEEPGNLGQQRCGAGAGHHQRQLQLRRHS